MAGNSNWTITEEKYLKELYEIFGYSPIEIYNYIPNRTIESIKNKIKRIGLKHTDEQKQYVKKRLMLGNIRAKNK